MREKSELQRAVGKVREYFSGRALNENTVLAAYMRAAGLPAAGAQWNLAKSAVKQGYSFEAAVRLAQTQEGGEQSPHPRETQSESPKRAARANRLDWYPKQFGPGDLDGLGAQRLLGTPNIAPADVLVRETAQNSWDAGLNPETDFCINLRALGPGEVRTLRDRVLVGNPPISGLASLLSRERVPVLEISDRGTVGLNGPVRNDQAVDPGTDTNFIDLLFNVGAPRDVHLGAGTYGFGKTVAYTTSRVGTVVYWTRCEGEEGLEDRFIASALGDGYDADGKRYTGRHWWGRVIDDENRVEPVTGNLARELGSLLFSRGFEGTETGTSILILDPIIDDGGSGDAIATLTDAILRNLWPKLLRNQTDRRVMRIRLQRDGSDQALPAIETHPQFGGYAACLLAVRSAQAPDLDERISWQFPLDTYEVRSQRPNKLLGHLALTRYPVTEAIVESYPSRSVALMRNRAELVVKYLERHQIGVDGFQWAAVFKPTEETDDSFADAEPPAHDDWIVASITDPRRKRDVNISLREIRKITDAFLSPNRTNVDSSKPVIPTGWVGDMLSDLIPHPGERQPAPSSKKGKSERRGGKRSAKPQARLVEVRYAPGSRLGWTRTSLDVEVDRAPVGGASVDVDLTVGIEGGSWPDDETIKRLGWLAEGNFATGPRQLKPKQTATYVYEARSELAIDVEVRVVDR